MKFYFISPFCLLRPTTNRIFDVRFCEIIAATGSEVTLIHPYYFMKENIAEQDIAKNYGVSSPLKFRMLNTPLDNNSSRWFQLLVLLTSYFFVSVGIIFSNRRNLKDVVIISRDNKSSLPMMILKKLLGKFCKVKIINTVHEVKKGKLNSWMYRNYNGLLVTTSSAKKKLMETYGIPGSKIERLVAPVSQLNYKITREEARKKINYNDSKPLIVYTGKLGKGIKELEYIFDAAVSLPQYNFILTGGKSEVLDYLKDICRQRSIPNISFSGFINDSTFISYYQIAADALISYYSIQDHVVEYNFPQKLVEYMHTKNPIVTPDFPATHDVINSSNAIIVQSDNVLSFVEGIRRSIEERAASKLLAEKAFNDVQQFSVEKSTAHLIKFFNLI